MSKREPTFNSLRRKIAGVVILAACFALYAAASYAPELVERRYSQGAYPAIVQKWSALTSSVRFSIAEFAVYAIALCALARIAKAVARAARAKGLAGKLRQLLDALLDGLLLAGALTLAFIVMWGMNYNRLPFAEAAGIDARPAPASALGDVCAYMAGRANELREAAREGDGGAMELNMSRPATFDRARDGFLALAPDFPTLGMVAPGQPKPVLSSVLMSYAGITGVYFPMTAEANVNTGIADAELPFTVCHELAHQLGYAREDEANFIAWLACDYSPYADYQYSGSLMALIHLLNRLREADPAAWAAARGLCSEAVNRDLESLGQFWQRYEGPVREISGKVNDTFLKANQQQDGVKSYGRMADLLIAYVRAQQSGQAARELASERAGDEREGDGQADEWAGDGQAADSQASELAVGQAGDGQAKEQADEWEGDGQADGQTADEQANGQAGDGQADEQASEWSGDGQAGE
ncbi:MAG: DUF3810 family protein [Clostridiales bacterium]|jgi:hypothetical protein|nr:DUF3810 family protein [Clostridiales bacterium]